MAVFCTSNGRQTSIGPSMSARRVCHGPHYWRTLTHLHHLHLSWTPPLLPWAPFCSQWACGTLPPVTQSSHRVPRGPTLDRGVSPGAPRCPHSIQSEPASVSSRARLQRATENPQRDTDPGSRPGGPSAPHHAALPAHGSSGASSGSAPHLPSNVRTQGPPQLHARLSPPGRTLPGSGAPLTTAPTRSSRGDRRR
jgi:hypothetical protein